MLSRFAIAILLASLISPSAASAKCAFFQFKCKQESLDLVNSEDLQSAEILSTSNATKSLNQFFFARLTEDPTIGYSYVEYSMVDSSTNLYSDKFDNAQEIVQRSLMDWIKSVFVTTDKIFVVSLDVYGDEAETQLLGHKPIIIVESSNGFRSVTELNDISLNGRLGYPRLSNRAHRIKLSVRYANTNDVTLDVVEDLLESASAFSKIVPSVGSLVDEVTLLAFKDAKNNLESILGKFEVSTKMSRTLTMRHAKGGIISFNYDFRAPNEADLPRVKLAVSLKHQESLLIDGGVTLPGDILNVLVHEKDDDTIRLRKFIQTSDISADDVAQLETAAPDVSEICQQIREALGKRLTAIDQTIALNAFVSEYESKFSKNWTTNNTCFRPGDIAIISKVPNLQPARIWQEAQPTDIIPLSRDEQTRLIRKFSTVFSQKIESGLREAVANGAVSDLPDDHEIFLVDEVNFLLGANFSIKASLLVKELIEAEIKLDRGLGCYSGDQFDTEKQPNVMGTLSMYKGKPIEILFQFSPSPSSRRRPELDRLILQYPTGDRLLSYRDGSAERSKDGCAGGFKPWDHNEAEVT
jgi:hypothetical protein